MEARAMVVAEDPVLAIAQTVVTDYKNFMIQLIVTLFRLGSHSVSVENVPGGGVRVTFSNADGARTMSRLTIECDCALLEEEFKAISNFFRTVTTKGGRKVLTEGNGTLEWCGDYYFFRIHLVTRKDKKNKEKIAQTITLFRQGKEAIDAM